MVERMQPDRQTPSLREGTDNATLRQDIRRRLDLLSSMIDENPRLRRYVQSDDVLRAAGIFTQIGGGQVRTGGGSPIPLGIFELLEEYHAQQPELVIMALLPDRPLVVTRTPHARTILAPVLGCTLNAIHDLVRDEVYPGGKIVISQGVRGQMGMLLEHDPRDLLTYDPTRINPADYVALAAQGVFMNEVFHKNLGSVSE